MDEILGTLRVKISAVFQASSRRDSRSQEAARVVRRKTNRRHMTGDHHGREAGRATLLVRAMEEILGTHSVIRRNTNRRHMIGDHHAQSPEQATPLVRAVDEILGTHNEDILSEGPRPSQEMSTRAAANPRPTAGLAFVPCRP